MNARSPSHPLRAPGFWLAAFLAGYMLFNVTRVIASPANFATAFGIPLIEQRDSAFVYVYGIRALFLGLCAGALLLRKHYDALSLFAFVGIVMPLGDIVLTVMHGAPFEIVLRHAIAAVVLFSTGWALRRLAANTNVVANGPQL